MNTKKVFYLFFFSSWIPISLQNGEPFPKKTLFFSSQFSSKILAQSFLWFILVHPYLFVDGHHQFLLELVSVDGPS